MNAPRWLGRFDSLVARLIAAVLCATLLAWLGFAATLEREMRSHAGELQRRQLAAYADMLWQNFGDDDDVRAQAPRRDETLLAFALYRKDGTLLAASSTPSLPKLEPSARRTVFAGESWIVEVREDETSRMIVGEPLHRQEEIADEVIERLALPAVLILALLLPVLAVAIHRGLKPLRDVDAELERRAPDNLDPIALPAPREVAPLVERLNSLFAQVGRTLERERRFTADAAHELRTPLAGLRAQLEIAQDSPRPAARAKALAQTQVGLDRVTRTLGQLLDLARLDETQLATGDVIDLPQLARRALADAGRPCTVATLQVRDAQPCHGHSGLIGLLLRNLIDNACRYAGTQATIAIEIDGRRLSVIDDGPGVAADDLPRLGERFFRPPGQRQSGAGLGVSIARRIADLHGGVLTLGNRPGGGFCASLLLPP